MDSILRLRRGRHIGRTERSGAVDPLLLSADPLPRRGAPRGRPLTWAAKGAREGLSAGGAGARSGVVGGAAVACQPMPDHAAAGSLRVALAGYGLAGRVFHASLVEATAGLELAAVVTNDEDKRRLLAEEHPRAKAVGALGEALGEDVDLVVVASPNRFHAELATQAIAAGKHVVVDKPLAVTAAQARTLEGHARKRGVTLSAFHNRRWDDDFLTLTREAGAGRLGRILRVESRFDRWRPQIKEGAWRELADPADGGGLLLDLGSHLADQAIQLLGPVAEVYAELDVRRDHAQVEDDVFVALRHAGGARSHLHAGVFAADGPPRFRVLGTEGTFVSRGLDPQEQQLRDGMAPGDPQYGARAAADAAHLHDGATAHALTMERGAWPRFYAHVVEAIRNGTASAVPAADAVTVLDVLEAARESSRTGAVVRLG
jgi:scyllo-inositol 2-dehydrogenase (NADP+)